MNKFTPGPWLISTFRATGRANDVYVEDFHGEGEATICDISLDIEREESDANARLIAAAPTMLEALEKALQSADAEWENQNQGHDWRDACEAMRAAIKAAKGE